MKKTGLCISGSAVIAILALQLASASGKTRAASNNGAAPAKTAEQVYKNIKVLKGVPADQLIPAMEFITAALGVHCDFCHVEGHFDKDDKKPKEIARTMMRMMFAVNKDNFEDKRKVTCYSCHRGAPKPVATPLIGEESSGMTMLPRGASLAGTRGPAGTNSSLSGPEQEPDLSKLPSPAEVIERYIQAVGGMEALQKISSRVEKGSVAMFGHQLSVEILAQSPGRYSSILHLPNGESSTIYDGHNGWMAFPGRPVRDMGAADRDAARMDADLRFPADAKQLFTELRVAKPETIDGREAYQILGIRAGQPPVQLYFDEQSGLLVRLERYAESPLGLYPTQINYAEYRETDGVKVPFRLTTARPGSSVTIHLDSVQQNVAIDESKFAKPSPPPGLPNRPAAPPPR